MLGLVLVFLFAHQHLNRFAVSHPAYATICAYLEGKKCFILRVDKNAGCTLRARESADAKNALKEAHFGAIAESVVVVGGADSDVV